MGSLFSLLFFSFLLSSGLMVALFPSLVKAGVGSPVTSSVELVMRPKHAKVSIVVIGHRDPPSALASNCTLFIFVLFFLFLLTG